MSRSFKKHPIYKDDNFVKSGKKFAKRRVRRLDLEELPMKGNAYKKYYPQYDIHDWIEYWDWREACEWYHNHPEQYAEYETEEEFYQYWSKLMRRK